MLDKESARKFRKGLKQAGKALQTIGVLEEIEVVPQDPVFSSEDGNVTVGIISLEAEKAGLSEIDDEAHNILDVPDDSQTVPEQVEEEPVRASEVMKRFLRDVTGQDMTHYTTADTEVISREIIRGGFLPVTRRQPDGSQIDAEQRLSRFFALNGNTQAIATEEGYTPASVSFWFRKVRERAQEANNKAQIQADISNVSTSNEHKLDEQPNHVRLAKEWGEHLALDGELQVALEEMLNPNGSHKSSDNKRRVANEFWDILVEKNGSMKSFDIEPKKLARLYRLFGIGFHSHAQNKKALHLNTGPDMLARRVSAARNQGNGIVANDMIQDTHAGMRELLGIVRNESGASPEEVPEAETVTKPFLQVERVDGVARWVK